MSWLTWEVVVLILGLAVLLALLVAQHRALTRDERKAGSERWWGLLRARERDKDREQDR